MWLGCDFWIIFLGGQVVCLETKTGESFSHKYLGLQLVYIAAKVIYEDILSYFISLFRF